MKVLSHFSRWRTRILIIALHVLFVGLLFLLDNSFLQQTQQHPWYTALYLLLVTVTIFQYLYTAGSNPGYVADALRDELTAESDMKRARDLSIGPARTERSRGVASYSSSTRLTLWLGSGSSLSNRTCPTCRVFQPPRSKHCHDCNKCVLRFDHYCAWLGTCVGYGNHCRFWWYIFEETVLCLWTSVMYAMSLKTTGSSDSWLHFVAVVILLCLILAALFFLVLLLLFHSYLVITNQTTHELIRRKRISEFRFLFLPLFHSASLLNIGNSRLDICPFSIQLHCSILITLDWTSSCCRNVPENVKPYSKGCVKNMYSFCCAPHGLYEIERMPNINILEERAKYSFSEALYFNFC